MISIFERMNGLEKEKDCNLCCKTAQRLTLTASTPGASPIIAGLQLDASKDCSTSDETPEGKENFAQSDTLLSPDCVILNIQY